jgi:NAD(P)-dependent dehydrogenase (short-subunit alcohol dehydrogenase family)
MSFDDFMRPVIKAVTAHYTIATTVATHMRASRSGVILVMAGGREAIPDLGGSYVAWSALAGLCRQLASELGSDGIRVAWLLSPGLPDSSSPSGSLDVGRSGDQDTLLCSISRARNRHTRPTKRDGKVASLDQLQLTSEATTRMPMLVRIGTRSLWYNSLHLRASGSLSSAFVHAQVRRTHVWCSNGCSNPGSHGAERADTV